MIELKRIFGKAVAFTLFSALVLLGGVMASASNSAKVTVSSPVAEAGDKVTVDFVLEENPGIWGMKLRISYDGSVLTLEDVESGDVFEKGELMLSQDYSKNPYVVVASGNSLENKTACGSVVTLTFKVGENAETGTYPISVEVTQINNIEGDKIGVNTQDGTVTVVSCTHKEKETRVVKKALCEESGEEALICKKCGKTFETKVVNPTGHLNTEIRNKVEATETHEGYTGDTYCTSCEKLISKGKTVEKIKISESVCTHEKVWSVTKKALCEESGEEALVCKKCGEIFETKVVNPTGHLNTEIRNKVEATETHEGYTGDTYCTSCEKFISKGKTVEKILSDSPDTSEEVVVPKDTSPTIISGADALFIKGSGESLVFVSSAEFDSFIRAEIDGETLDGSDYAVRQGSTVVKVSADRLEQLTSGTHTFTVVSESGSAVTSFTVEDTAKIQDTPNDISEEPVSDKKSKTAAVIAIIALTLFAIEAVVFFVFRKRRKLK